jgi:glycosyltransferase involved in cell wall biosynthesis
LLDSIRIQSFRDFEIIISDDSDTDSVKNLLKQFENELPIRYFKNDPAFGTPANWNAAISKATGEWIKLMHDDDWFADERALEQFFKASSVNKSFIFSAYLNIFSENESEKKFFPASWRERIIINPLTLLPRNVIGPPSVTMIHRSVTETYDEQLKWRVDIEYYIRLIRKEKDFHYIDQPLINVGIGYTQVTNYCKDHPEVELPEGLILLKKYGTAPLKNVRVYDAWWRILRNVKIRNEKQLLHWAPSDEWPPAIFRMIKHQSYISYSLLKFGPISKIAMTISYLFNRSYL